MNPTSYQLHISPKTKCLNFFRKFFILLQIDKLLPSFIRSSRMNTLAAKLVPPNYLYPPGSVRNAVVDGINLKLDVSDTVGHSNYFSVDEPAHKLLFKFVQPGMTAIDIGANIGATTLNLAKKVGSHGKVFSFEPSPYNFSQASINISLNNFSNIVLINQGLGNKKTTANLYNVNTNNRGMQRLLKDSAENNLYDKTEVEIDTLDTSMQKYNVTNPSIIKIDVEGYELNVLKGGIETIKKYKPALFIELDDNNLKEQGSNAGDLIQFLLALEYKIVNAATGNVVNDNSNHAHCHFDILCT